MKKYKNLIKMDELDGFITNIFRTEKPVLTSEDFDKENVWVCDLLDQDIDLAKEYIRYRLSKCKNRMDKLAFLYQSRSCFNIGIKEFENRLDPEVNEEHNEMYRLLEKPLDIDQIKERIQRYKKALAVTEEAICCYIDCSKLDCVEKENLAGYSNSQLVLIFYYFFKHSGLEPRRNVDIAPIAKFLHLITGKQLKNLTSSDFYKKLQTVPNFKTDKQLIADLEAIKSLFIKAQLNEIVKMIDNEIDIARNEINQTKLYKSKI